MGYTGKTVGKGLLGAAVALGATIGITKLIAPEFIDTTIDEKFYDSRFDDCRPIIDNFQITPAQANAYDDRFTCTYIRDFLHVDVDAEEANAFSTDYSENIVLDFAQAGVPASYANSLLSRFQDGELKVKDIASYYESGLTTEVIHSYGSDFKLSEIQTLNEAGVDGESANYYLQHLTYAADTDLIIDLDTRRVTPRFYSRMRDASVGHDDFIELWDSPITRMNLEEYTVRLKTSDDVRVATSHGFSPEEVMEYDSRFCDRELVSLMLVYVTPQKANEAPEELNGNQIAILHTNGIPFETVATYGDPFEVEDVVSLYTEGISAETARAYLPKRSAVDIVRMNNAGLTPQKAKKYRDMINKNVVNPKASEVVAKSILFHENNVSPQSAWYLADCTVETITELAEQKSLRSVKAHSEYFGCERGHELWQYGVTVSRYLAFEKMDESLGSPFSYEELDDIVKGTMTLSEARRLGRNKLASQHSAGRDKIQWNAGR